MSQLAREQVKEEYEFKLPVSMIDVVFLLLIFFMVASRFKQEECRLNAHLPDDGVNRSAYSERPREAMRLRLWKPADGSARQVYISLDDPDAERGNIGAERIRDLDAFRDLAGVLTSGRAGLPEAEFPVIIDAHEQVAYQHVIMAIDACKKAGIENVKFQAPPER